jgi:amino-acid N-acetyltransferase
LKVSGAAVWTNLIKKRLAKLRKLKMEIAMEIAETLIRKAEKKDFPAIKNLLSTYFLDLEGLKAEEFILVEKSRRIIGCAAMITARKNERRGERKDETGDGSGDERRGERRSEQVFLEIHSIAIHPSFRGKGIGRKLIEYLITTIKTSTIQTSSDYTLIIQTAALQISNEPVFNELALTAQTSVFQTSNGSTFTILTSSDQNPARELHPPEYSSSELQTLELYVRTTAPGFFEKLGFEKLPPSKKQELWNDCTQCELFEKCTQTVLKYPG